MRIKHLIYVLLAAILMPVSSIAQTLLSNKESKTLTASVTQNYKAWSTVAIDGKVSMDKLPLSPSVKIFMRKGEEIAISIRAPFVGEVGRARIKGNEVLLVNKLRKVYVKEQLGDFFTDLPVTLGDLQNLLLARAFVAGKGELSSSLVPECDFYVVEDGWLCVPENPIGGTVNYGFQFDTDCRLQLATAVPQGSGIIASGVYSYSGKKTIIDVEASYGSRNYDATLSLNAPQYGAKGMDDIKLDGKYKKVTLREFLKSLSL